jgi:3-phosphoshikimate 1-carboxyvinyltransferase
MRIRGSTLHDIEWTTSVASAQTKSAILLAALAAGVSATVHEPVGTRDHTERMMRAMGASVATGDRHAALSPVDKLRPLEIDIPADPSSAAFFVALALLARKGELMLTDVCLNPRRLGFLEAAREMGGEVHWDLEREDGGEPVGTIRAKSSQLRGITLASADVPAMIDELVILGCLAARASGETVVHGAEELRVKESDRIAALVNNLRAIGVDADETADGYVVRGHQREMRGVVDSHGDHRMAMAFGVLGRAAGNAIRVRDPECVDVSYPAFWHDLSRVTDG